jgi:hypothetical protein
MKYTLEPKRMVLKVVKYKLEPKRMVLIVKLLISVMLKKKYNPSLESVDNTRGEKFMKEFYFYHGQKGSKTILMYLAFHKYLFITSV